MEERMQALVDAIADSKRASEEQFKTLNDEIKRTQEEMKKTQEEMTQNVVRRVKRTRQAEFKRKGNEKQFRFNDEIAEKLETVEAELEQASSSGVSREESSTALERAKQSIKQGMELVEERQKMIRLADRSEYGWEIVNEYEADELAEDSDDEKRISKAEKAAEQRLLKKKKAAAQKKSGPKWTSKDDWWTARAQLSQVPFGFRAGGQGSSVLGFPMVGPRGPSATSIGGSSSRASRPVGPCFSCGEFGHLKHACPKPAGGSKYPNSYSTVVSTGEVDTTSRRSCMVPDNEGLDDVSCGSNERSDCGLEVVFNEEWEEVQFVQGSDFRLGSHCDSSLEGVSVKGRLRERASFWEGVLHAPPPVVSIVRQGYILPFVKVPVGKMFTNQLSAVKNEKFVTQAVMELVRDGRLKEVKEPPIVCSPLLVVTNASGKKRLVINLKYVNSFLKVEKFKYEDIRTGLLFCEKNQSICTFDLKSGYHHIDIHVASQQYLGCKWEGKFYVFTVLPFGLSTACYVFTKLTRPLVRWWRGKGMKVVMYIDDGIIVAPQEQAAIACKVVRDTLDGAGFVLNIQKSQLVPAPTGAWLGFEIDLAEGIIRMPQK